jgi:hypothetical protein
MEQEFQKFFLYYATMIQIEIVLVYRDIFRMSALPGPRRVLDRSGIPPGRRILDKFIILSV